jgi:lysozyme family protein
MARFNDCLERLFDREGRVDTEVAGDPDTSWGVTQDTYDSWRRFHGLPLQDVDLGTPTEFTAIYRERFWDACKCPSLPKPLDEIVFDVAVNSGQGAAIRLLQEALGGIVIDGIVGSKTLMAAQASETDVVAARMIRGRVNQYTVLALTNPKKRHLLMGWLHRVGKLLVSL